jgi:hypothetical protein
MLGKAMFSKNFSIQLRLKAEFDKQILQPEDA